MKLVFSFLLSVFALNAVAQEIVLDDFGYTLTDITTRGLNKDVLFSSMDRDLVKLRGTVCSNRAHVWSYDFERQFDISTAKIFLFFTKKTGQVSSFKTWWYHVAPAVNEAGELAVMDAGFPGMIKGPQSVAEWLETFASPGRCKEMRASEIDLVELIHAERTFPETTRYGTFDCYYIVTPAPYWTPYHVVSHLTGRDENGKPVSVRRDEFSKNEFMQACLEASAGRLGRIFGGNKKECQRKFGF